MTLTGTTRRTGTAASLMAVLSFAAFSCTTPPGADGGPTDNDSGPINNDSGPDLDAGTDGGHGEDAGDGGVVVDGGTDGGVDRCAGAPVCAANAEYNSSCECRCKQGFIGNTDNSVCVACDCDSHATCSLSASDTLLCTCGPGYTGSGQPGQCLFNPCYRPASEGRPANLDGPCPAGVDGGDNHASCEIVADEGRCFCDEGYVAQTSDAGTILACRFDECSPSPCDDNATCEVTSSGHTCACIAPLVGNGTPGNCKPANHCGETPAYCDTQADCLYNEMDGTSCKCHLDFDGTGRPGDCHLHDHCTADPTPFCDENAICSFHDRSTTTCAPACSSSQTCENGHCVNPGSSCACKPGYDNSGSPVGAPGHCTLHNFCNDTPSVCAVGATCTNHPADGVLFTCACPVGQAGEGTPAHPCHAGYDSYSTGYFGACAIRADQKLFCWGDASQGAIGNGQLDPSDGDGAANNITSPTQVGLAADWLQVSGGQEHVCAIRSAAGSQTQGTLWCWGLNGNGQDGYDTFTPADAAHHPELGYNSGTPKQVGASADWTKVVAGWRNTCALKADTSLWCWGYNEYGVVVNGVASTAPWLSGVNTAPSNFIPTMVTIASLSGSGTGWTDVVLGDDHVCGLRDDGSLYCWGNNLSGQLGDGTNIERDVPVQISAGASLSWNAVAAGRDHTLAIKSDGTMWCWGDNAAAVCGQGILTGQLPQPRNTPGEVIEPRFNDSPWADLSCGPQDDHCCAIKADQSLWCWGYNAHGEAGQPTGGIGYVTIPLAVRGLPAGVTFSSVEAGGGFTCALDTTSRLWCFGSNGSGELGQGSIASFNTVPTLTQ